MSRNDDAVGFWQRAIAVSPWRSDYHAELALTYFHVGNWNSAAAECREALRQNPAWVEIRKTLVRCYLQVGDAEAARAEQAIVLGLEPTAPGSGR
jgi:tetratricopeptide (TPR) repeat protein